MVRHGEDAAADEHRHPAADPLPHHLPAGGRTRLLERPRTDLRQAFYLRFTGNSSFLNVSIAEPVGECCGSGVGRSDPNPGGQK